MEEEELQKAAKILRRHGAKPVSHPRAFDVVIVSKEEALDEQRQSDARQQGYALGYRDGLELVLTVSQA